MNSNSRTLILLINGTWAKNAPWIQADSEFANSLREGVKRKIKIEPFSWNGKNSHKQRIKAGHILSEYILKNKKEFDEVILIGHSHGGNVIMYALKQINVNDFKLRVITMATPFLNVQERKDKVFINILSFSGRALLAAILFLILFILLIYALNFLKPYNWYYSLIAVILSIVLFFQLYKLAYKRVATFVDQEVLKNKETLKSRLIRGNSNYKCLNIIYEKDEILPGLQLSNIVYLTTINSIKALNLVYEFITKHWIIFSVMPITISVTGLTAKGQNFVTENKLKFFENIQLEDVLHYSQYFYLVPLIIFPITYLVRSNPVVFGLESFGNIIFLSYNVSKKPPHHQEAELHSIKSDIWFPFFSTMNHSRPYQDKKSIDTVVRWINNN